MDQLWGTVSSLLDRNSVQLGYLVSAVVLVACALGVAGAARWEPGRRLVAVLAALSLALFPALTLARRGIDLRRHPSCDWSWALESAGTEQVLNVVLLLPAGFFAAWALRRVWPVVLAAVALSVGAEVVQAVLDLGVCQEGDVVRNVGGAFGGAVSGALLGRFNEWRAARRRS